MYLLYIHLFTQFSVFFFNAYIRLSEKRSFVSGSGVGEEPDNNEFYLLQRAKFTRGFFSCDAIQSGTAFSSRTSIKPDHARKMKRETCLGDHELK